MVDETNSSKNSPLAPPPPSALVEEFEAQLRSRGVAQPEIITATQVFRRLAVKTHRGPLPSAEDFAAYENVFPGAAKEILDMAIRQQQHAHACEIAEIQGELRYRVLGMASAVVVVAVLVAGAVACSIHGQTAAAIALGASAGLTTLASAFIRGRRLFEENVGDPRRPTKI